VTAFLAAEGLNPNQVARRSRVLEAAVDLAVEGGDDAVQMRDAAARAQEIARTLRLVWFATLLGRVNGWQDLDSVGLEFAAAVHLLLDTR
jgi:hypothetical protein